MKTEKINNSNIQVHGRTDEGPARFAGKLMTIDLNDSKGVVSGEEFMTRAYGEEGVGWDRVSEPTAETYQEREKQQERKKFGHDIVTLVVTPNGDRHYKEKFPEELG